MIIKGISWSVEADAALDKEEHGNKEPSPSGSTYAP
jgi:hypothetical protein